MGARVLTGLYVDSVGLMRLAAALEGLPGVRRAWALGATDANRRLLRQEGLWSPVLDSARTDDVVLAVRADTARAAQEALAQADALLVSRASPASPGAVLPRSLRSAVRQLDGVNLALISVPGPQAASEAAQALALGLHVFLFSDGVALADEVVLKREARRRGRLLMGPECGTSILDGHGLGFANRVRRGPVGLVGASGTGLQEVATLVHRWGSGLSQVIGTGARDLDEAVGGLATLQALALRREDAGTAVVVIVSKPPSPAAARAVLEEAARVGKPVVACLLGWSGPVPPSVRAVATLDQAAATAVGLATGRRPRVVTAGPRRATGAARRPRGRVRGLFTGGTLCEEAARIVQEGGDLGHRFVDFGGAAYTTGRPHPMIDPTARNREVAASGNDRDTAVVLVDVMLGDGAHPDPAPALASAIQQARARARRGRRGLEVVAHVVGTDEDPQDWRRQEAALQEAGARTCATNREAAELARALAGGRRG